MRKHTPGPWVAESYNGKDWEIKSENMPTYRQIVPTCSDPAEAKVYVCTFKRSEYESSRDHHAEGQRLLSETNAANARLIAAAPEMLECLEEVREHLFQLDVSTIFIDELISKATG